MMLLSFYKQGDIYISEPALDLRWWIIPPMVEGDKWVLKLAFSESYQQLQGSFDSYSEARRHASSYAWRDSQGRGINAGGEAKELREGRSINRAIITELNEKGRVGYQDMFALLVGKWGFALTKSHYMKIIKQMCGMSQWKRVQRQREKIPLVNQYGRPWPDREIEKSFLEYPSIYTPEGWQIISRYPVSKQMRIDYAVDQIINGVEPPVAVSHIQYGEWIHYADVHYRAVPGQVAGDDGLELLDTIVYQVTKPDGTAYTYGQFLHNIKYTISDYGRTLWSYKVYRKMYQDLVHLRIPNETYVRFRARWIGGDAYVGFGVHYWAEYGERIDFDRGEQSLSLAEVWKNRNTEKAEQLKNDVSFEGVPSE